MEILQDKYKGKRTNNKKDAVGVSLKNSKRLLPETRMAVSLSELDVYNQERRACTKFRLIFEVNAVCSNVLFNTATEIVKDEGSDNAVWLTVNNDDRNVNKSSAEISGVIGKTKNPSFWDGKEGVLDTQLSSKACGFEYHCGYDIFDNHILRKKSFKAVNNPINNNDVFNTISDYARYGDGSLIYRYPIEADVQEPASGPNIPAHLYNREDIMTYEDSVNANLTEENGWFGFYNASLLRSYDKNGEPNGINQAINSGIGCEYIDMYPGRDLYSFVPKYNPHRNRIEKNWNYCLTYPSSSTTEGISFINERLNSLKAVYFEETRPDSTARHMLTVYSASKHGLSTNDTVNVYRSYERDGEVVDETCISAGTVSSIVDDFTFRVYAGSQRVSSQWLEINDESDYSEGGYFYYPDGSTEPVTLRKGNNGMTLTAHGVTFNIVNGRCNVDPLCQDISYKRVEDGQECSYYVRIFSRLPNFKFAERAVSERTLYDPLDTGGTSLIEDNEMVDFQDSISRMGFATNAYSDKMAELVVLDDVDVYGLRDNLGRPLTEIFLTIVKNNSGYKDWYGKDRRDIRICGEDIEYSHCFGKVNCGFVMSPASSASTEYPNVLTMHNEGRQGMNVGVINGENRRDAGDDVDEINFKANSHYYGDLCEFSTGSYREKSIQMTHYRFNTAQRELNGNDTSLADIQLQCVYHELVSDDWDSNGFEVREYNLSKSVRAREGYYYMPHTRIELRSFSDTLYAQYPKVFVPLYISLHDNGSGEYLLRTTENNYFEKGNKFVLYHTPDNTVVYGIITSVLDFKSSLFVPFSEDWERVVPNFEDMEAYRVLSPDETIPSHAFLGKDGSFRYFWHDVVPNGFNGDVEEEEYPFANGAFYVNKKINLYVRRQDPHGENGMWTTTTLGNIDGARRTVIPNDSYITEGEVIC